MAVIAYVLVSACGVWGGESRVVSYEAILPDVNGNYPAPLTSDARAGRKEKDANGVMSLVTPSGERHYHPFDVATQAMSDGGFEGTARLDMEEIVSGKTQLTKSELEALQWLTENGRTLANGGTTWDYTFPLYYNTFTVHAPWPSAFAQARIIQAFVYAYKVSKDRKYLLMANRAALAYVLDVSNGGLRSLVDGHPFFEEVPLPDGYSPHILNGHLYSVAMLYELFSVTRYESTKKLADDAASSVAMLREAFDAGYWTKYDLIPRLNKLIFCVEGKSNLVIVDASLIAQDGSRSAMENTAISGTNHFFVGNLPENVPMRSFYNHPGYTLKLVHVGKVDRVGLHGIRPDIEEFYDLKLRSLYIQDGKFISEYAVPFRFLANWNLSRTYQRWHARLARKIWEQSHDPNFLHMANRWDADVASYDEDAKERSDGTCVFGRLVEPAPQIFVEAP